MRYVIARYHEIQRDEAYRIYISDVLKAMAEGIGGVTVNHRFYDVLHPKKEDKRTANEIVEDIISRAGIEVI